MGALYLASKYSFLRSTIAILTLLLQQASISLSNALLFRSVQAGTRENLKMISSQRAALDEARRSREDALKAAKIKSNFLASMSHELRTPFRFVGGEYKFAQIQLPDMLDLVPFTAFWIFWVILNWMQVNKKLVGLFKGSLFAVD